LKNARTLNNNSVKLKAIQLAPQAKLKQNLRQSENWSSVPIKNRDSTFWLEADKMIDQKMQYNSQTSAMINLQNEQSQRSTREGFASRNRRTATRWAAHGSVRIVGQSHGISKTKAQQNSNLEQQRKDLASSLKRKSDLTITSSIVNREIIKMTEQLQSKMMLRVNNQTSFNQSLIKESSKQSIYTRTRMMKEKDNRRAVGTQL